MFRIDVDFCHGTEVVLTRWLKSPDPAVFGRARWLLEQLNALEDRGSLSGDCLKNPALGWQVWHLYQGDFHVLYRYQRIKESQGVAKVVDVFQGTDAEARQRAQTV